MQRPRNLDVTGDRAALRRGVVAEVEGDLIDIAPAPALGRIVTLDDRVPGAVKVLGRVLLRRGIATTDMPAAAAKAQVNPGRAGLETFLAAEGARGHLPDRAQMRAVAHHA